MDLDYRFHRRSSELYRTTTMTRFPYHFEPKLILKEINVLVQILHENIDVIKPIDQFLGHYLSILVACVKHVLISISG